MGRYRDDDDDRPRKRSNRKSKANSGGNPAVLVAVLGGGGLVAAIAIFGLMSLFNSKPLLPPPSPDNGQYPAVAGTTPGVPATIATTPEQNAANAAAYEARLERDRQKSAENQKAEMQQRFGPDKVVTVVIKNVPGDPVAADKYLNRKLFRAAYHDYKEAASRAQAQTEQNKEQAKQQAIAQAQQQGPFGPMFVHYRYKQVNSDLPYPQIVSGTKANGTFVYHAAPVIAIDQFAGRFEIGEKRFIDPGSRTVTVEAQLPNPVPDPDVEELYLQYGRESVAKIRVKGAKGQTDSVTYYLESQTKKSDPAATLAIAGIKPLGSGDYELFVAPVTDLQVFAERLGYGSVGGVEPTTRVITIEAALPDDLPPRPTPAELAEINRKEMEKLWNKPSNHDEKPRDGEDFYVWALRVIKGNHSSAAKAALTELKLKDVEEDHLREVSDLLISTLKDSWNVPEHLEAMAVWKTDGTERAIIGLIGNIHFHRHSRAIMETLAKFGTKESARALSMGLADHSYGEDASRCLIEMGGIAEEFVVKFADHREDGVRARVYEVLGEIGTEKSLSKLRSNSTKEKDVFMKDRAKDAMEKIKQRSNDAKATSDPDSPFSTKPKK